MGDPLRMPRYQTVKAAVPELLALEVARLENEGWEKIGLEALAAPSSLSLPRYWVQQMKLRQLPDLAD